MAIYLKYATASQEVPLGYFVDSTDGNTEETGLTIANTDILIWKSGGTTLGAKASGGATHISNGIYYAVLDATDTNTLGPMVVFVHVAGALTIRLECCVLPAKVYDSLIAGSDNLEIDVIQLLGTAWLTPGTAGTPDVNVKLISGDAVAADNCEADYDGTGYVGGTIKKEADLVTIHGTALTETAGQLAAGFKKVFDVATPVFTAASVNQTGDAYAKVDTEIATMQGNVTDILADTNELQAELADGGRSDLILDGIAAKTTNIPASPAAVGSAMTLADDAITASKFDESTAFPLKATDSSTTILARKGDKMDIADAPGATGLAAIADAVLLRDWTAIVASVPARCLLNAARALRNKFLAATGAAGYKVKKEDDSTDAWTGVLTVDGDGNITAMDPDEPE